MQVCILLQTDNHASTTPLKVFYRPDALPAAQPTTSKHWRLDTTITTANIETTNMYDWIFKYVKQTENSSLQITSTSFTAMGTQTSIIGSHTTQCYLPPNRGEILAFNPAKPVLDLLTPNGCNAVSWSGWLVTHWQGIPACRQSSLPSTNWAWCRVTSLLCLTTLPYHPTEYSSYLPCQSNSTKWHASPKDLYFLCRTRGLVLVIIWWTVTSRKRNWYPHSQTNSTQTFNLIKQPVYYVKLAYFMWQIVVNVVKMTHLKMSYAAFKRI